MTSAQKVLARVAMTTCTLLATLPVVVQAQSSVTIYGALDLNLNTFTAGDKAGGQSITRVTDGTALGRTPSRLGFKIIEDLGDGLRAGALLEGGINADTGTQGQGGLAWGRQIYLFIGHDSWGDLRLGRQYMENDVSVLPIGSPYGDILASKPSAAITGNGFVLPIVLDLAGRINNAIRYGTPTFKGLSAAIELAPGEATADRFHELSTKYVSPTLSAAASYGWNKDRTTGQSTNKVTTLGASYDFGVVKLHGSWQTGRELTTTSGNGTVAATGLAVPTTGAGPAFTATRFDYALVGFAVPIGFASVGSSYLESVFSSPTGRKTKYTRIALVSTYDLSKRTGLYAGISYAGSDLKDYINERRIIQVGIKNSF